MASDFSVFNVLLIDDEIEELELIKRIFRALTHTPIRVDHAYKCSEAVNFLQRHPYDLVLLDNHLSGNISAEFSAPFIVSAFKTETVAIISNDIHHAYLSDPKSLGVDHVIDKAKIIPFLRDQHALKVEAEARNIKAAVNH
ncbi:hypothetical protein GCM10009069_18100 [Algimonas arctica]|uniref:Response regulatory domain-containing protein n=1 Tax=Algimonas arctica TaxID=1479486 RepID=A0A8J3CSM1_9PROT|nr:response regulator [Algimonas arctica]GHA95472.1 hypothetical protein GCM10009069_18100 [Algimonas arctica]